MRPDPAGPLVTALLEAQARGLLGPGPVELHLRHTCAFSEALELGGPGRSEPGARSGGGPKVLDLGSGGGVPGLILAVDRPDLELTLLDAARRRCRFLDGAVGELGLVDRVEVLHARAEDASRLAGQREQYDAVVARSFGPPAVTAECARGFLRPDGALVVSEPPGLEADRWIQGTLQDLALRVENRVTVPGAAVQVLRAVGHCPEWVPRRSGVPRQRPLY